jgi:hypothetical protein
MMIGERVAGFILQDGKSGAAPAGQEIPSSSGAAYA